MKQATQLATSVLAPVVLGLLGTLTATLPLGCKKDEPPPPLPSAAPAAVPTPTAPLELAPEEPVVVDAGVDAGKKPTGGGVSTSMGNCCAALLQNAESAPEPNKTYLKTAGQMCGAMVAAGKSGPGFASALQGVLRGAGMPSACR